MLHYLMQCHTMAQLRMSPSPRDTQPVHTGRAQPGPRVTQPVHMGRAQPGRRVTQPVQTLTDIII